MSTLATLAALKADLGVSDAGQDAQLAVYLDQASSLCLAYVGRPLALGTYQDVFRRSGSVRALLLSVRPVVSIEAITVSGQALDLTDGVDTDQDAGILYGPPASLGCWDFSGHLRIVVTYTAGYVLPGTLDAGGNPVEATLPAGIQRACLDTAKALYHNADRDPLVRSESEQGVGSTSWLDPDPANGGLPASAAAMLARWCRSGIR